MRFSSIHLLLLAFFFLLATNAQATTYHINNQTGTSNGSNGIYADPQDAHDVASDGDTLSIDGTRDEYTGSLTIRKRLVVMGPGYFQEENPNTNTHPAMMRQIYLYRTSGGDANSGAAGSIVQGIDFSGVSYGGINVQVNNVIIRKNRIHKIDVSWSSTIANQVHNLILMQNYFADYTNNAHIAVPSYGFLQDALVTNNIFEGVVEIPDFSKADFLNNVFISPQFTIQSLEGVVRNNVFISNNPTYALSADSITHNISMGAGLPSGNGNILNATASSVFLQNPAQNGSDGQYQLKPNSPALGAGYNGVDIGPYGGIGQYVTYGAGEAPSVLFINIEGIINPGQNAQVLIRATSGN